MLENVWLIPQKRGVIFLVFLEAAGDEWWVLCQTDLESYLMHKLLTGLPCFCELKLKLKTEKNSKIYCNLEKYVHSGNVIIYILYTNVENAELQSFLIEQKQNRLFKTQKLVYHKIDINSIMEMLIIYKHHINKKNSQHCNS